MSKLKKIMKYIEEDLDYILIRVKLLNGSWDNLSLSEVSDRQFLKWLTRRVGPAIQIIEDISPAGATWTPQKKLKLLNSLSKRIGMDFCMIKREARPKCK